MNRKFYKNCAVPLCKSTSIRTPKKLFIHVPKNKNIRRKWLTLARRDPASLAITSTGYFCEDHFDLANDMDNYIEYTTMGVVSQIRMREGCLPTKFACQPNRAKTYDLCRPVAAKRRRLALIKQIEEELYETSTYRTASQQSTIGLPGTSLDISMSNPLEQQVQLQNQSDFSDPLSLDQCRFCGEFSKETVKVTSEKPYLVNNRTAFALNGVSVDVDFSDDTLPNAVCRYCDEKLQELYDFVKQVKTAQDTLIYIAEENEIETLMIKTEACSPTPEDNDTKEGILDSVTTSETEFVKSNVFTQKRKNENQINVAAKKPKPKAIKKETKQKEPMVTREEHESCEFIIDIKEEVVEIDVNSEVQTNYKLSDSGTEVKPRKVDLATSALLDSMNRDQTFY